MNVAQKILATSSHLVLLHASFAEELQIELNIAFKVRGARLNRNLRGNIYKGWWPQEVVEVCIITAFKIHVEGTWIGKIEGYGQT